MAGFMKNAMSYLGMTDVVDDDDPVLDEEPAESSFDSDHLVTPMTSNASSGTSGASRESSTSPFPGRVSRITTIHPKTYDEAQMVGRALRDGVPVVLNLTGVPEAVAYRIVDFSAGVVFGVRGSIERVTPRVFLLSPANIKVDEPQTSKSTHDLFSD
ncbi:cell division protein SepF [Bifidobacterium pullorum subsp. saeculare]|uniref:cell division protein SepF n=1 Tax=Bifidobacterium pullorum TaxID=78448 RepID=UPI0019560A64|nr:cell division protein SepF [Bifidobacterium pullorum]MBM6730954.1 cell division protein SepF [Bifidobacterium pullorum subsp. saeculare]